MPVIKFPYVKLLTITIKNFNCAHVSTSEYLIVTTMDNFLVVYFSRFGISVKALALKIIQSFNLSSNS